MRFVSFIQPIYATPTVYAKLFMFFVYVNSLMKLHLV